MKSTARYVLKDKTIKLDEKISLFKNFINQTENQVPMALIYRQYG